MNDYHEEENQILDDINQSVNDVERAVRDLQKAISDKWSTVQGIVAVFVLVWIWDGISAGWNSKWRYATFNGVDESKVVVDKRPHDCDFLTAPLGAKSCRYDKQIATVMWARSKDGSNSPIRSFDDGKTWASFTPDDPTAFVPNTPTTEGVVVAWTKVED